MKVRSLIRTVALAVSVVLISSGITGAWDVTINGRPTSDMDNAMAVAVDTDTGSIFVAGRRQVSSSLSQFFVVKFTADGRKEWQEVVAGTADIGVRAGAVAVAVDSMGFVFVAGTIGNSDSAADFVIMKIDGRSSRKRVLWTRVIDGVGYDDVVDAMALTPDGGVAVAGLVSIASGAHNFYLMKFTGDGQDAWPAPQIISGSAPDGLNAATAVGALPNGDIAVTGWLTNAGSDADFVVGRFDGTTGERHWLVTLNDSRVNGGDVGTALSVAPNGDIIVGGITQRVGSPRADFSVFRFNGAGVLLWQTIIDRGFFDAVRTVAVAPNGDIIAGGTLEPPSGPNNSVFFVVSLGADGRERWRYESPGTDSFLEARAIAFDRNGNPVVTGQSQENPAALSTFTVVAFNKDMGTVLWNVPIIGTAPFTNAGNAVVSAPSRGAVIAVGVTQNDRTSFDMTVSSSTEGHEDWRQVISGHGKRVDRDDAVLAMAVDPQRNSVALAGFAQNTGTGLLGTPHEFRVVKIRNSGTIAWKYDLNDPFPHLNNAALALAVDVSGDFFAAGRTCSTSPVSCFAVVRIGKNGKEVWRTIIPGLIPGRDEARAIMRDPQDGNVIVAGRVQMPTGTAFAVFKLDANTGMVLWPASAADFPLGTANALALTSRNTVAVAGVVDGSFAVLVFDTSTGTMVSRGILPGSGEARSVAFDDIEGTVVAGGQARSGPFGSFMAVAKFDGNGAVMWSENFGTENFGNAAVAVAVHQETGAIAVGGTLAGVFTVMLLRPDGEEQWRSDDIPGAANAVAFAGNNVVAVGQFRDGSSTVFAVIAFADDGTEQWRRTFRGTAGFGSNSAAALAINEEKEAVFIAGVITDDPTGPDMFAVGLGVDGSDLSGFPGAHTMATPSTRRAVMKSSAVDLGPKDTSGLP
jgi:uncharacterized delta-60 repeat protein